jgi:hypothetical protein
MSPWRAPVSEFRPSGFVTVITSQSELSDRIITVSLLFADEDTVVVVVNDIQKHNSANI